MLQFPAFCIRGSLPFCAFLRAVKTFTKTTPNTISSGQNSPFSLDRRLRNNDLLSSSKFLDHNLHSSCLRSLSYVQGQTHEKRREYFYFIDHHGQLFLDDARIKNFTSCFKDKEFLLFFFQRLKLNETGNYEDEFPYLSPCGRERNYVRCDDVPIVFTHFLGGEGVEEMQLQQNELQQQQLLSWGGAGEKLTVAFNPQRICMLPSTGRVYHPTVPESTVAATSSTVPPAVAVTLASSASTLSSKAKPSTNISPDLPPFGLIKSSLAIELSKYFDFESGEAEPPTHFTWMGQRHELANDLVGIAEKYSTMEE